MNLSTFDKFELLGMDELKQSQNVTHFVKSPLNFFRNNLRTFTWGMTCKGTEEGLVRVGNPVVGVTITMSASVELARAQRPKLGSLSVGADMTFIMGTSAGLT